MKNLYRNKYVSYILYAWIILILSGLGACTDPSGAESESDKENIEDMLGRRVDIPLKIDSVVAIGPGALRLLVYLQADDMVAGVEEIEKRSGRAYIYAQPELAEKPTIGPPFTGDAELIAARDPDLIFMTYATKAEANELQKKTGIPVTGIKYANKTSEWKVLENALQKMGKILGKTKRANSLIRYYRSTIDTLNELTADIPAEKKPEVYLGGLSHRGVHGINSTAPYYEPFTFTNARNVASSLKNEYSNNEGVFLDTEQLLVWKPEVIFIDLAGRKLVKQNLRNNPEAYKKIPAFRNGKVYGVHPYNWYSTNYATVLANSWYVASVLYPEKFKDTDIIAKTNSIYKHFLGNSVYDKLKEEYGGYSKLSDKELFGQGNKNNVKKRDSTDGKH